MTHWYDKMGSVVYEVPYADPTKGMRSTTLADARKMKLDPGVTSVIDVAAKHNLVTWMINQTVDAAWNNKRHIMEEKEWKKLVLMESRRIGKESAELGNKIHNSLEQYILGQFEDSGIEINGIHRKFSDFVVPVIQHLNKIFPEAVFRPEQSFSHNLGFGGKVDLHDHNVILDFKTKDSDDFDKQLAYDGHCMQLAAYREGLDKPTAKCYNLFISTRQPGLLKLHEWKEEELQRGWEMFKCLLNYWKLVNKI